MGKATVEQVKEADLAAAREELEVLEHPQFVGLWTYREHGSKRQFCASVMIDGAVQETIMCVSWKDALREAIISLEVEQRIKAALAGGDNPVGEVVKAARKVVGAPAGPLPDELVEALKGLDEALADLDGKPEHVE